MLTGKLRFTPNALTSLPRKTKQEAYKIRPRGTCFKTEREMKKDTPKYVLGLGVFFGCFFAVSTPLQAQNTTGVTDKEILIGSWSAPGRASDFLGTEKGTGAKAYFAPINDGRGGGG